MSFRDEGFRSKVLWAKVFGWFVLVSMLTLTFWAQSEKGVSWGFRWLFTERWGIATLQDATFGFLFFYLWILHRERSPVVRIAMLPVVLLFGNIAMSAYFLIALYRLPKGAPIGELFRRVGGATAGRPRA